MKITTTNRRHTKASYEMAVKNALYGDGSKMHNPAVKYSPDKGFFVESKLDPHLTIWEANFDANTGKPYGLPTFEEVLDRIATERAGGLDDQG